MKKVFQVAAFAVFALVLFTSAQDYRGPVHYKLDPATQICNVVQEMQPIEPQVSSEFKILTDLTTSPIRPIVVTDLGTRTIDQYIAFRNQSNIQVDCYGWIVELE